MTLISRIAHATAYQIAAKIVGTILGVVALGVMTRGLGPEGYGYYTVVVSFLTFFAVGVDLGLNVMTPKLLAEHVAHYGADPILKEKLLSNLLALRITSALVALGIAPLVALLFHYPVAVHEAILVTTLSFLVIVINQIFVGFFQTELAMGWVAVGEVAGRAVLVAGVVLAASAQGGLFAYLAAIIVGNAVTMAIVAVAARYRIAWRLRFDVDVWRRILARSWPIGLSIVMNLVYLRADTIILSLTHPAAEVGYYGAAYRVIDLVAIVPPMIAGLVLPLLTAAWISGSREKFYSLFNGVFETFTLIALPLVIGTPFIAREAMQFVAGAAFAPSGALLVILMIAGGVTFFGNLAGHTIVAVELQKKYLWAYAVTATVTLTGYLLFIPKLGAFAAAWFTVVSETLIMLLGFLFLWHTHRIMPRVRVLFPVTMAATVMAITMFELEYWTWGWRLAAGVIVYIICLCVAGVLTRTRLQRLLSPTS